MNLDTLLQHWHIRSGADIHSWPELDLLFLEDRSLDAIEYKITLETLNKLPFDLVYLPASYFALIEGLRVYGPAYFPCCLYPTIQYYVLEKPNRLLAYRFSHEKRWLIQSLFNLGTLYFSCDWRFSIADGITCKPAEWNDDEPSP